MKVGNEEAFSAEKARKITEQSMQRIYENGRRYACERAFGKIKYAIGEGEMSINVKTDDAERCKDLLLGLGYSITKLQNEFSKISWEDNGGSTNNQ